VVNQHDSNQQDSNEKSSFQIDYDLLNEFTHDLKTPLGSARILIDFAMAMPDMEEKTVGYLQRAIVNLDRMEGIIREMLDLAKLETQPEIFYEPVPIEELIQNAIDLIEVQAVSRHIQIHLTTSGLEMIDGDYHKLLNVMMNLLSNAVKYNRDNGDIFIETYIKNDDMIGIQVRDTGIGIPEKSLDRVFKHFYRAAHGDVAIEGTGLGLAIVKRIIDLHHGEIILTSDVDVGTTFEILLPIRQK